MELNGKAGDFLLSELWQPEFPPTTNSNSGLMAMRGILESFRHWKCMGPRRKPNDLDMKLVAGNIMFFKLS